MNADQEHPHDAYCDPLDEVLRTARWPEPQPNQLRRLQVRWSGLWLARVRRRRAASVLCLVAAAAGLLIAVCVWMDRAGAPWKPREIAPAVPQTEPREGPPRQVAETPDNAVDPPGPPDDETKTRKPEPAPDPSKAVARSRPATPYEKLAFRMLTRRRPPTREQPDRELLQAAMERRVTEPNADLDELAEPLLAARRANELALIAWVQQTRGARQVAAIDLLGRIGTRQSVPLLAGLAALPETHAAAVRGLARLADAGTIALLAGEEVDPDLQEELFAALLGRGDARAVAAYLEFVGERETRGSALAALDRVADPPLGLLFESLASPQQAQRSAAAVVLGRIDGPEVSRRLIQMVLQDVLRREALLALTANSGAEASQFVALARNDPSLAGSAQAAQYALRRFFPPNVE